MEALLNLMNNVSSSGPYNSSMKYKIVSFSPTVGQIEIECEGHNQRIAIDLPIDNGMYPEGDDLDIYIRGFIPTWLIERSKLLAQGVKNKDTIQSLVADTDQRQSNDKRNTFNVSDIFIKRQRLLQESDWTQLPDVPLSEVQRKLWADYRQQLRDITHQPLTSDIKWPTKPNILGVVYFK